MIKILAYLFAAFWLLIVTFILWPYDSSAGEWNDKPVMCEQKEIALEAVKAKGEIPFITAVQSTKVRDQDGLSDIPAHVPLQIFVNLKTKTFSILEFHPSYNSICIIGYGDDWNLLGEKS